MAFEEGAWPYEDVAGEAYEMVAAAEAYLVVVAGRKASAAVLLAEEFAGDYADNLEADL